LKRDAFGGGAGDQGVKSAAPYVADLYGEILLSTNNGSAKPAYRLSAYFPGLILVAIASSAAAWFSDHYGMPMILGGLLIGLALNFVAAEPRVHAGLDLCSTNFLRIGIVLLGTQVTVMQIGNLGIVGFGGLVCIMALVMGAGLLGARIAGQGRYVGWLAGGATAICGASAAMAIYAIIGRNRMDQAQFTFTLVGVTLCSAIALTFYPVIAAQLALTDRQAGFLMGAAIHDVAQSLGAGFAYSQNSGEYATVVKLARVALLAPIVMVIGIIIGANEDEDEDETAKPTKPRSIWTAVRLPWFVVAFFAVLALNSVITTPEWLREYGLIISKSLLLFAVTAMAMRSRLDSLLGQGWRSVLPVVIASLTAFCAALFFARMAL
jgi:uncharacterized integral membrane protein (TIGR00698 family)